MNASYSYVFDGVDADIAFDASIEPAPPPKWPTLHSAALHGLAGAAVRLACANSEADPAAVLAQFLARYGASCGSQPRVRIGDANHYARLFTVIVGETARARKGTSEKPVNRLFIEAEQVSPFGPLRVHRGGIGSGEGIVHAVRDRSEIRDKDGEPIDQGIDDKRLLVIDEELAGTFRAAAREGSTASAVLRQAWDAGDLGTLTKNNPTRASGAHVCVIGHVTIHELNDVLNKREIHNGLANRFLWIGARRSRIVAWPDPMPDLAVQDLGRKLASAISFGTQADELRPTDAASELWGRMYARIAAHDAAGAIGAVTARAEAQVIRLAAHYALLDSSSSIEPSHLRAAAALWEYARNTALYVFTASTADSGEARIMSALERGPKSLTEISKLFNNRESTTCRATLQSLETAGRIVRFEGESKNGGRRPTYYRASDLAP